MSLEIGIVLAHLSDRVLVPYRFRMPERVARPPAVASHRNPLAPIPALFEIPVAWSDEYAEERRPPVADAVTCDWKPVHESLFVPPGDGALDGDLLHHFRNGRRHTSTFDQRQQDAADLHVRTEALGFYSYFFFLDDTRRAEVIELMRRFQPKRPYRDLAERIAASFGRFNAIHLRRGDFVSIGFTPRARDVSGQEIVANLVSRMSAEVPLVICTDGTASDEVFGPIQRHFRQTIFLDRYIEEDPAWRHAVDELPYAGELVIALLSQLVASHAEVFAGTLFSTFTALIHRLRGFAGKEPNFLYCFNDFASPFVRFESCEFLPIDEGPFTWNRVRYPISPEGYSWVREWPEAFDAARASPATAAAPSGSVELPARQATVHGTSARFMIEAGEGLIGFWMNVADYATWELSVAAAGTYAVEIRYACPEDSAGSRYRIAVDGAADHVEGRVWNTGGWYALTPWLALGRLRVPAGTSTLVLTPIDKPSLGVMNLSAVRLVPVEDAHD